MQRSLQSPGEHSTRRRRQLFDQSDVDAPALCPTFTATGPYPSSCANFNQLGFRVPFIAVSPFSKPHYVSHTTGDHTSLLKLIEMRWLNGASLTRRDANANPLLDMFDFVKAPLVNVNLSLLAQAPLPTLRPTATAVARLRDDSLISRGRARPKECVDATGSGCPKRATRSRTTSGRCFHRRPSRPRPSTVGAAINGRRW